MFPPADSRRAVSITWGLGGQILLCLGWHGRFMHEFHSVAEKFTFVLCADAPKPQSWRQKTERSEPEWRCAHKCWNIPSWLREVLLGRWIQLFSYCNVRILHSNSFKYGQFLRGLFNKIQHAENTGICCVLDAGHHYGMLVSHVHNSSITNMKHHKCNIFNSLSWTKRDLSLTLCSDLPKHQKSKISIWTYFSFNFLIKWSELQSTYHVIALYSYCKKTALSYCYLSDMAYKQQFDDMSV